MKNNIPVSVISRIIRRIAILATLMVTVNPMHAQCCKECDDPQADTEIGMKKELANEESRPVTGLYGIEIGTKTALSTYLSPLTYSGMNWSLMGNWKKVLSRKAPDIIMEFDTEASAARLLNKSKTAYEYSIDVRFGYGMKWRRRLPAGVQVTAGGELDIQGGALYLPRNSNNPAAVLASISLAPTAGVSYHFNIRKLPVLLTDEVRIPSLGIFFSPQYGETYYEIYLGNHKGLVQTGWWGNNFRIDNLLCATLDFGRTAMTIGYRFRTDTSWVNQLNTQIFSHSFVVGVIPGGIGLKRKHPKINMAGY